MKYITLFIIALLGITISCRKDKAPEDNTNNNNASPEPRLVFKFKFDSTQTRLDNFGNPSTVPAGNAAQSPVFHGISANYIEFAPDQWTQLGNGEILYTGPTTTAGGSTAIDFDQAIVVDEGEEFFSIPLSQVAPGTYEWIRVSLTYQNYEIEYRANNLDLTGRLASFVGFNTYLTSYTIDQQSVTLNANKLQGYWGFETVGQVYEGQAPGTTVVNPISGTSPVPAGSCVVTGSFASPLAITGTETSDITVTISLSTNNSFEWEDDNMNGIYEPVDGDTVVDMGLRGLVPIVN